MPAPVASYQPDLADSVRGIFTGAKTIFLPGYGRIYYDELMEGSPVYTLSHGNSRVERTYVCQWEHRERFVRAMLGYPKLRNNYDPLNLFGVNRNGVAEVIPIQATPSPPNDVYVSRVIPHALTDFTDPTGGESYLYAQSVSRLQGQGPKMTYDVHGVPEYHFAIVTVVYESVTFKIRSDAELRKKNALETTAGLGPEKDRYITKLRKPGGEYLALPRSYFAWYDPKNGSKRSITGQARLQPSMELIYTWHQVPFLPQALFKNYVGCVNSDFFVDGDINNPYVLDFKGYRPGTLLLLSIEVRPYRTAVGAFVHDITYRMKHYEPEEGRGHNFFLRYMNASNTLHYTKLTHNGRNDSVAVAPKDTEATGPYSTAALFPPNDGKPVYPYKPFIDLFTLNTSV